MISHLTASKNYTQIHIPKETNHEIKTDISIYFLILSSNENNLIYEVQIQNGESTIKAENVK